MGLLGRFLNRKNETPDKDKINPKEGTPEKDKSKIKNKLIHIRRSMHAKRILGGACDLCNMSMPPSGGVVTAEGMKALVELGYDPYFEISSDSAVAFMLQRIEKQGITRTDATKQLKYRITQQQMGSFGICPKCFYRIQKFMKNLE